MSNSINYNRSEITIKREKIERYSGRIAAILAVTMYLFMLFAVVYAVLSIGILFDIFEVTDNRVMLDLLVDVVMPTIGTNWSHNNTEYTVIMYGISAVLLSVISLQISYMYNTIRGWGKGNSPFEAKNTRGLRRSALITSSVMLVFQPLYLIFGIFIVIFTLLMEYGGVLEENAKNTIRSHEQMILSLSEVIEAKSGQTGLHVKRVSEYSRILAEGCGLPTDEVEEIRVASMLHDIGKLLISSEILEKPGKLTAEEFDEIKKHTRYGYNLLENTSGSLLTKAKTIADEHHEKWDGTGYSKKIGKEISLEARIVAVADVFDALVSKRSYKDAWSTDDAKKEINSSAGTHFDPEIVKAFDRQYVKMLEVNTKYRDRLVVS